MKKVLVWDPEHFPAIWLSNFNENEKSISGWVVNGNYNFRYDKNTGKIYFGDIAKAFEKTVPMPMVVEVDMPFANSGDYNEVIRRALDMVGIGDQW